MCCQKEHRSGLRLGSEYICHLTSARRTATTQFFRLIWLTLPYKASQAAMACVLEEQDAFAATPAKPQARRDGARRRRHSGRGPLGPLVRDEAARAQLRRRAAQARDRVGGRVLTTEDGADLGGSWAWGEDKVKALGETTRAESVPQRCGRRTGSRAGRARRAGGAATGPSPQS